MGPEKMELILSLIVVVLVETEQREYYLRDILEVGLVRFSAK